MKDKVIKDLIDREYERQNNGLELIASENYVSSDVLEAAGSILTNKYAEGYPNKRYYGGCEFIDKIEQLAIDRCCKLFKCKYANVQPHSGSQANAAAYRALMPNGGKVMSLELNEGGHLTHGSPVSFSSNTYDFCFYHLDSTGHIDYDFLEKKALEELPDVILCGFSAYPYYIDFKKFREVVDKVNKELKTKKILKKCYLMVDMAHIAGLIAAGEYNNQNPCDYADVVTSTTQKTLRGPRGGIILTNDEQLIKRINSAVFPYYQGGPLEHIIAAKAVCFEEASKAEFKKYIKRVKRNTKTLANELKRYGLEVSGTDTHLFLLNTKNSLGITGKEAQERLERIGITTNKNMLPNDTEKPDKTSGLRIGLAALTTRGLKSYPISTLALYIYKGLTETNEDGIRILKKQVISFCNETLNKIPQLNTEERFTEPRFNQPRSSKNDPSKTILNAICEKCGNEDVCKNSKCELYRYMYYIFYNSKKGDSQ